MKKEMELFDEAIQLEKNIAGLYRLYAEKFTEDAVFWQGLAREFICFQISSAGQSLRTAKKSLLFMTFHTCFTQSFHKMPTADIYKNSFLARLGRVIIL